MSDEQELETGYGPRTPSGDNVTNDFQQETAESYAALARARGDRVETIEGVVTMTDAGVAIPFFNRAALDTPLTPGPDTVERIQAFYGQGGPGPYLLDSAWPTPDLRVHGFQLMGHPPLMLRPANLPLPAPPPGLDIVRVTTDQHAHDLEYVLIEGYPAPMMQPFKEVTLFTPDARRAPGWNHYVGYLDGRPVAAGSAYAGAQLVRVDNIAAMGNVRGKGVGAAITAATIATDLTKPAVLVSSDLGRPTYTRLGFQAIARVTYWLGMR